MKKFKIGNFTIGGEKTFIIAELSANHNGNIEIAKKTIHAAKEAGQTVLNYKPIQRIQSL